MIFDEIIEIGIDKSERLYIKPAKEKFTMIYRSATEVHWDMKGNFLYSPKPREWSYFDWYKHIISTVQTEYNCNLRIKANTSWINIPQNLKSEIEDFNH